MCRLNVFVSSMFRIKPLFVRNIEYKIIVGLVSTIVLSLTLQFKVYTTPKKYRNTYKWSDNSKSEKVLINQSNSPDAQFCPAHFDTLLVELRWFWAELWPIEWLKVTFQKWQNALFKQIAVCCYVQPITGLFFMPAPFLLNSKCVLSHAASING